MTSPNTDACRTRARTALLARDVGRVLLVDVPELCDALDTARLELQRLAGESPHSPRGHREPMPPSYTPNPGKIPT